MVNINEEMNQTPLFMREYLNSSNSSTSAESDEFFKHYHYLCKICRTVPIINFSSIGKIEFFCKCNKYPRRLNIRNIYDLLYYSEEIDYDNKLLKCQQHGDDFEKYIAYCQKCKTNLCNKCCIGCIKHQNKVIVFSYDEETLKKSEYIKKIISEKNIVNEQEINTNQINFNIININEEGNEEQYFLGNNIDNDNNNDNENEKFNYINNEKKLGIYNFINLFKIIIKDYQDYPNFNHIETIYNLEKFVNYYLSDYNEINLNYEFNEENIKDDSIELFGEDFFSNNKENCFLIINEKIMDLNHTIKLNDIFDIIPNNYPIKLDVKLIERKRKVMTNWTSMFNNISSITSKSNFVNYDSSNIISFKKMFYNCELIEYIPDISKLNTQSAKDMSYMFFNCSSLKVFPDISKWNTGNMMYLNSMFENCSSITSLPDISIWNAENFRNFNYLFKNCRSLPNIPDISKWNISGECTRYGIYEGDALLLENNPQLIIRDNIISRSFYIFIRFLIKKIFDHIGEIFVIFINFLLFLLIYIFFPLIFNSLNIDNLIKSLNDPKEYFNLTYHFNISRIEKLMNITNSSYIKEISENNDLLIKKILNFTNINENREFESDLKLHNIYNILHIIAIISSIIIIVFIYFNIKYKILDINHKKEKKILFFLFIFDIIIFIVEILNYNLVDKLTKSIEKFYNRIKSVFLVKIPLKNRNEVAKLKSFLSLYYYFLLNLLSYYYYIIKRICKINSF